VHRRQQHTGRGVLRGKQGSACRNHGDQGGCAEDGAHPPAGTPSGQEDPPEESAGDATSVVLDRWMIADALGSLSMEQRSVINAAYYEGRSIADISARLRIPEGTVKSRLHYGLRTLRLALQEKGVTPE
jgi:DNA-directed RNA polymerase specialized sigma24 family protein